MSVRRFLKSRRELGGGDAGGGCPPSPRTHLTVLSRDERTALADASESSNFQFFMTLGRSGPLQDLRDKRREIPMDNEDSYCA